MACDLEHLFSKTIEDPYHSIFKDPFYVKEHKDENMEIELSCIVKPYYPKKWVDSCMDKYNGIESMIVYYCNVEGCTFGVIQTSTSEDKNNDNIISILKKRVHYAGDSWRRALKDVGEDIDLNF